MNSTMDQCEDFYEYACCRFISEVVIHRKDLSFQPLISNNMQNVRDELLSLIQEPTYNWDSKPISMANKYFADCMDSGARKAIGSEKLLALIAKIGGFE